MNKSKATYFTLFGVILLLSVGCSKSDDEPNLKIPVNAVYDFVTIVESSSNGSKFEMRKSNDSPIIVYASKYDLASSSTHVSVGDRVIICYRRTDGPTYTSGPITLYAYSTLSNTEAEVQIGTPEDFDDWHTPPFDIQAIWRTGQYINIQTKLFGYMDLRPDKFIVAADDATLDEDCPVLHLMYTNRENNDGENRFSANASFDISKVWDLQSCRAVKICAPNAEGNIEYVIFSKFD